MPLPTTRTLQYNVTLAADTRPAEQAFQRVAQNVDQIAKKAQQISVGGGYAPGGVFVPAPYGGTPAALPGGPVPGGGGGGGKDKDDVLGGAAKLAKAAAVVQMAANLVDAFGNLGNSMIGLREKALSFVGAVPVVGDALSKIGGAILDFGERIRVNLESGWGAYGEMAEQIREAPFARARDSIRRQQEFQLSDIALRGGTQLQQARLAAYFGRERADMMFAPEKGMPGRFDDNDGYDATLRQARMARSLAGQGVNQAMAARDALTAQIGERSMVRGVTVGVASGAVRRAKDTYDADGLLSNKELARDLSVAESAVAKAMQEQTRYQQQLNQLRERSVQLADQEKQFREAAIGVSRAELSVVQAKQAALKGDAAQFGTFDPARQQAVLRAARRTKEAGFQELSPEQKQLLLGTGLTAEFARDAAAKAAPTEEMSEILKLVGRQDKATLDAAETRLKATIVADLKVSDESYAKFIERVGRDIDKQLADTIVRISKLQLDKVELQRMQGRVSQK